jgi:catechol 2,3-dioxygenase-like lactoylglutathione lyase family enzyme
VSVNGVNRVIVAVRDLEKSKSFYAALLGAEFHDASWTGEPFGIQVAISWNAGIELCAPVPGKEKECVITPFLEENGEGVINIVFDVDDADESLERAKAAGAQAMLPVDYTQAEIDQHLGGLFTKYKEYFLDTAGRCGYTITLGQLERRAE